MGQVEMATAIAAFKAEQGDDPKPTAPGIGDRKDLKKLQEVSLANGLTSHLHRAGIIKQTARVAGAALHARGLVAVSSIGWCLVQWHW